jgi:hypothetical protein
MSLPANLQLWSRHSEDCASAGKVGCLSIGRLLLPCAHLPTPLNDYEFSNKYAALFEQLTGLEFEKPDPWVSVRARIRDALAKELPEYF